MNVKEFAVSLTDSLIERGIDREKAVSNVIKLTHTLTEEDLREVASYRTAADFKPLTDSLCRLITQEAAEATAAYKIEEAERAVQSLEGDTKYISVPKKTEAELAQTKKIETPTAPDRGDEISGKAHYTERAEVRLTDRGKRFFIAIAVLTTPLWVLAAVLFSGVFLLCVVSVCALIAASLVLMCAVVVGGTLSCLVGVIYGITQMFTSVGIGIYEIGVGLAAAGLCVVLSVLIYHFATLVLPFLLRQLFTFFRQTLSRVPAALDRFREECNRL